MSNREAKFYYLRKTFWKVWFSYSVFILLFTCLTDLIRNSFQSLSYYAAIALLAGALMAFVESIFFRVVWTIPKARIQELQRIIKLLSYEPVGQSGPHTYMELDARGYFFRKMDLMLTEQADAFIVNINLFHSRYFRKLKT